MIDTDKYEGHTPAPWSVEYPISPTSVPNRKLIEDAPLLLAEVIRLREENKILAKYMDIVQKYDDALLADGDTDPRWSELYD